MQITWAPMALMAELRRTTTGEDPARRYGVFRNMGPTYLYKVLPDGSTARDDDNEFPHLDALDNVVLGYAVHRFKDPFAAWIQKESGWLPREWEIRSWSSSGATPRSSRAIPPPPPRPSCRGARLFPGVGHLVMRSGWGKDATWIEFACGPYFAKHDHLDTNHFVIYHKGYLAIDAGADYTDTESPHYLNQYRRTIAHNTMLVYQPGERFFWGENLWPAANDGGQRMDSSRFWNSVRSLEDWRSTRDLWDRGPHRGLRPTARALRLRAGRRHPRLPAQEGRGLRARSALAAVLERALRPRPRRRARTPPTRRRGCCTACRSPRSWTPAGEVAHPGAGRHRLTPGRHSSPSRTARGRLAASTRSCRADREVVVRGGPGFDFWTPGDEYGGAWGSGKNWPLDPPAGGPLPTDPYLKKMWLTFWGGDMQQLSPVEPARGRAGRLADRGVTGGARRREDVFLHALEIGDKGAPTSPHRGESTGHGLVGRRRWRETRAFSSRPDERSRRRPRPRFPTWRAGRS